MFSLGFFFFPRRQPLTLYEGIVLRLCIVCVLSERETNRENVRGNRGYYSGSAVGFVSSFLLDNRREGLDVWGGRSPNWVNHVYLCLSGFMCFFCLCFPHILCVSLLYNI